MKSLSTSWRKQRLCIALRKKYFEKKTKKFIYENFDDFVDYILKNNNKSLDAENFDSTV